MLHRTVIGGEPEQATQDGGSYLRLLQLRQIFAGCLLKGFYAGSEHVAYPVDIGAENIAYKNVMTLDYTNGINYYDQYFKRDFDDITAGNDHQAPAAILNRQKGYEARGVPIVPKKKHRFRRWLNN